MSRFSSRTEHAGCAWRSLSFQVLRCFLSADFVVGSARGTAPPCSVDHGANVRCVCWWSKRPQALCVNARTAMGIKLWSRSFWFFGYDGSLAKAAPHQLTTQYYESSPSGAHAQCFPI